MKNYWKTVLIGVSGGIAAFKIKELIVSLKDQKIDVHVILTKSASAIVTPRELEDLSSNKVNIDLFNKDFDYRDVLRKREVKHIQLADKADMLIIAPATANIIGKIASGIADDFLTTTVLATRAPILICPSMNVNMWKNPVVQSNITKLKGVGYQIMHPDSGALACGYEGEGRLPEISKLKKEVLRILSSTTKKR